MNPLLSSSAMKLASINSSGLWREYPAGLRHVVVGRFQTFGDRIGRGDEILLEDVVRAF